MNEIRQDRFCAVAALALGWVELPPSFHPALAALYMRFAREALCDSAKGQ
jgi:hypothetical protein